MLLHVQWIGHPPGQKLPPETPLEWVGCHPRPFAPTCAYGHICMCMCPNTLSHIWNGHQAHNTYTHLNGRGEALCVDGVSPGPHKIDEGCPHQILYKIYVHMYISIYIYIYIHMHIYMYTDMCVVGWWCMQGVLLEVAVQPKGELEVSLLEACHHFYFLKDFCWYLLQSWLVANCHLKLKLSRLQLLIALLPTSPLGPAAFACM